MLAPTLGLFAMLVGIGTTWLVVSGPALKQDPDARFWYGFSGLSVLAPLALGAAVLNPLAGVAVLAAVSGSCLATCRFLTREAKRRSAAEAGSRLAAARSACEARHDLVLRAWSRYELDPAAAIENPGMNDVHLPETAALARALGRAEQLRHRRPAQDSDGQGVDYPQAVIELESAFRRALASSPGPLASMAKGQPGPDAR